MRQFVVCASATVVILVMGVLAPTSAPAGGVVGNGTPASCTDAALDAALAGGGDLTFNCGTQPFTIAVSASKAISLDTNLDGGGVLTLVGVNHVQLFHVNQGATLGLHNATVRNAGNGAAGGAIDNDGTLTVTNCIFARNCGIAVTNRGTLMVGNTTFVSNRGTGHGPCVGSAINNAGDASVSDCTFAKNFTIFDGGAIFNGGGGILRVSNSTFSRNRSDLGGAIYSNGRLTVANCTFSANRTRQTASAIYSDGPSATITNSTVSQNRGPHFAGGGAVAGFVVLQNTIVSDNHNGGNCGTTPDSNIVDGGHNLRWPARDTSCVGAVANPKLFPLVDNGGATRTMALRPGSAAINAGDSTICDAAPVSGVDQRGYARPGSGAANCSIGAYEYNASPTP